MADNLDEVFGMDEAAQAVEPVVDVQPEPVDEAPLEPEPEPVVEQPQAFEPSRPDPGYVPIAALLDEREQKKALAQELEQFKRQQPAQPANIPDPYDDPNGFSAHIDSRISEARQAQKVDTSYHLAVRDYGKDKVEEARAWALEKAQSDPVFMQQVEVAFQTQPLPIDWVIQQHKRDGLVSQIGDRSIDDFVKDYIAKNPTLVQSAPAPATAAVVPAPASPTPRVPRSLASQASSPSDVRQTATGPLVGVDALFS